MMHGLPRCLAVTLVLLSAATASKNATTSASDERADVCIVGAGPSGVGAAVALADRNYSVALLERADGVGGQAYASYTDPSSGFRLHTGAIIILTADYPRVLALARRLDIDVEPYAVAFRTMMKDGRISANGTSGTTVMMEPLRPAVVDALRRFAAAVAAVAPALRARGGLPVTLHMAPALAAPADAWLQSIGAGVLAAPAAALMYLYGYSHLADTCAGTFLNYVSLDVMMNAVPPAWVAAAGLQSSAPPGGLPVLTQFRDDIGFAEVLRRAVAALLPRGSLRLRAQIAAVERPPPGAVGGDVVVRYRTTPEGSAAGITVTTTLHCGALINTAGQTLSGLSYLGLDSLESALFSHVRADRLFTTAMVVRPPLPSPAAFYVPPPGAAVRASLARALGMAGKHSAADVTVDTVARPAMPLLEALVDPAPLAGDAFSVYTANPGASNRPAGVPFTADPGVALSYHLEDYHSGANASAADIAARARALLAGALLSPPGAPRRTADVRAVTEWQYNPRPAAAAVATGWYDRVDAIQGRRRTFHAGGLFTFWDVEQAMRSGIDLVERFF